MEKLALFGGKKAIDTTPEYKWPIITPSDKDYLLKMIEENEISYNFKSEEIDRLEMNFKKYLKMPYCLALNSGTSALYTAFIAIGISEGDEVIVPSYTFPATVIPLIHMGAKIIFADSENNTPLISIEDVKKKVSKETKLILVTHMDGFPVQVNLIRAWLKEHEYNALILEDCAQAIGAEVDGVKVGSLGDLAIFSFQQKKLLTGGEGGLLIIKNKEYYERAILLSYLQKRSFEEISDGRLQQYCYTGLGFNFRIHPLAAGMVNQQFSKMDNYADKRRQNMRMFEESFNSIPEVKLIGRIHENTLPSYFSFKFLYVDEAVDITKYVEALNAEGVPIVVSTTKPLHLEPIFSNFNSNKFSMDFLNKKLTSQFADPLIYCETYSKKVLRLPAYYDLTKEQVIEFANAFRKVGKNKNSLK
ncbi:aminotransferase class V-fold PLP-dependent enzyme [Listeria seeligeri]|uniref:DegT/DnrJ/EryC1/StrS family aminotransferase n=1 Tax=Listeria seeligeri TaxID=1640 RepID=UPI001886FD33|nr:aminotransferase class V-fold PLP-dependent enzyme [Listeria seeligeri]MBF2480189.1 aminotransferase class V-fold PLP-dependent enzyme [Listeria seeligeri]